MFKKFVSYYRKHLGLFLIDMAAALIMAGIDLIYPSFTRTFMNDYIPNRNVSAMINISLFLLILFIIRLICSHIVNYWGAHHGSSNGIRHETRPLQKIPNLKLQLL